MSKIFYKPSPAEAKLLSEYAALPDDQKTTTDWEEARFSKIKRAIKKHYITEQNMRCCYCRRKIPSTNARHWDLEHVLPRKTHIQFIFELRNLAVSCPDCNIAKEGKVLTTRPVRTRYPNTGKVFKIIHPHFDEYDDHMMILLECIYIPMKIDGVPSPKARATIELCGLIRYQSEILDYDTSTKAVKTREALGRAVRATTDDEMRQRTSEVLIMAHFDRK